VQKQITQFLEHMSHQKSGSSNTTAAYRNDLQQLLRHLQQPEAQAQPNTQSSPGDKISWNDVTPEIMNGYLDMLKDDKKYAAATIARKVASVKSFFQYLKEVKSIKVDPSEHLETPKVTKNRPQLITAEEIKKLLEAPAKSKAGATLRDKALLEVLSSTGMRVTELVNLNLDDVNLKKRQIICIGTRDQSRALSLSRSAVNALTKYLEGNRQNAAFDIEETALFLNHRGQRLTRQGLWLIIKRYVKSVGISDNITPHTLRHSFANHLLDSGVELTELQRQLGHASVTTTLVYKQMAKQNEAESGEKGELIGAERIEEGEKNG